MQSQTGSSKQTLESQVARARTLERAGQWSGAIDAYLAITTQDTADLDFLEGVRGPVPHGVTQSGLTKSDEHGFVHTCISCRMPNGLCIDTSG